MKSELIEWGGRFRVENGPVRTSAVATEELLQSFIDNGRPYKAYGPDASGNEIRPGHKMDYLNIDEEEWTVYEKMNTMVDSRGRPTTSRSASVKHEHEPVLVERWMPIGRHRTRDAALKSAKAKRLNPMKLFSKKVWRGDASA